MREGGGGGDAYPLNPLYGFAPEVARRKMYQETEKLNNETNYDQRAIEGREKII